ncbi:MAG: RNA ligase family protein [Myxococcales bacterium]|nr:RNA ligase family protein [Myxococcales bacterium]
MLPRMHKYPRTYHLEGSRFQLGDHDLDAVPFAEIHQRFVVAEEKMDGANAGLSFADDGTLLLQSRGHYLSGGARERHFALFKQWARAHRDALHEALGRRYVMYGEWLYAKHTCFYDQLPHYFMEFDVLDRERMVFLATRERAALLAGLPVVSVAVLWEGHPRSYEELAALVGPSRFKSPRWREALVEEGERGGVSAADVVDQTDRAEEMEGLYLKVEERGVVTARLKLIRQSFTSAVIEQGEHWLNRPIVANRLAPGVDLWGPRPRPEASS